MIHAGTVRVTKDVSKPYHDLMHLRAHPMKTVRLMRCCALHMSYSQDGEGNEIFLCNLTPGNFFGELAFLNDQPRAATVTANEEVKSWLNHGSNSQLHSARVGAIALDAGGVLHAEQDRVPRDHRLAQRGMLLPI